MMYGGLSRLTKAMTAAQPRCSQLYRFRTKIEFFKLYLRLNAFEHENCPVNHLAKASLRFGFAGKFIEKRNKQYWSTFWRTLAKNIWKFLIFGFFLTATDDPPLSRVSSLLTESFSQFFRQYLRRKLKWGRDFAVSNIRGLYSKEIYSLVTRNWAFFLKNGSDLNWGYEFKYMRLIRQPFCQNN